MPQINLAKTYQSKVAERLTYNLKTTQATNNAYNWDGDVSIFISSIENMPVWDYNRSGTNRYGIPLDIGDYTQVATLAKDRSFTGIIDKGDVMSQKIQKKASSVVKRQIDEVLTPELDRYNLSVMAGKPGGAASLSTIDYTNVYGTFLKATAYMDNHFAPENGRVCFIVPELINEVKKSAGEAGNAFMMYGNESQNMLKKGVMGEIDNVQLIKTPSTYMPAGLKMLFAHKDATVFAKKLQELVIHENPPGINGNLIEGRILYDAFVLDNKIYQIYAVYEDTLIAEVPEIVYDSTANTITITSATAGATIYYTLDGSDPRRNPNKLTYGAAIDTATWSPANGETKVRAYAEFTGYIDSIVADETVPVAAALQRL